MRQAEYEIMYRVEEHHWWYRALRRNLFYHLDRYCRAWREQPILDAGCGTGANLERLGGPDHNLGIDLSADALRFCRQRGLTNTVQADIARLPFDDHSFHAVISTSVLYHCWVPDVPAALRECCRVLRPGGWLLLDVPAYDSLRSAHDEAVLTARRFNRQTLGQQLLECGFTIERMSYWTCLLFPAIFAARQFRLLPSGRDFDEQGLPNPYLNAPLDWIMRLESGLFRAWSLPFGNSLAVVARRK